MTKKVTEKEEAFRLFSEGKDAYSPEVKALKLKGKTRYNYYSEWQKLRGLISSSPEVAGEANGNRKANAPSPEVVEAK